MGFSRRLARSSKLTKSFHSVGRKITAVTAATRSARGTSGDEAAGRLDGAAAPARTAAGRSVAFRARVTESPRSVAGATTGAATVGQRQAGDQASARRPA